MGVSRYNYKTVVIQSYIYYENAYTGKKTLLYLDRLDYYSTVQYKICNAVFIIA